MMKQMISKRDLNGIEKRTLTTTNIAQLLIKIFENHIGVENEITRNQLFKKIFKKEQEDTLQDWVRWEFVKKAMHYLRQRTHCFIASRFTRTRTSFVWSYFVVSTMSDAQYYSETLQRSINSMRRMQDRVLKSVQERWFTRDWKLPVRKTNHPVLEER